MTEVQPLTDEEIAEIEASWQAASRRAMDGSTAIREVNMLLQAGNVPSLIATIRQRTKQREQAMAAATQATADAEFSTRHWGEALRDVWPMERERAEALRQRDEALAERDKWRQIAYDQAMLLLASCDDWMSRNVDAINVQMEQYRDEAVALLADVEAYFDKGINLNDLISYALRRATNPGA
jgi:hypothetical protein